MRKRALAFACGLVCACTKTQSSTPFIQEVSPTFVSTGGLATTSVAILGGGFVPKVVASASGGVERFDKTFAVAFVLDGGEVASVAAEFEQVTRLSIPAGGLPNLATGTYLLRVSTPQGGAATYDGFQVGLVPTLSVSDAGAVYPGSTAVVTVSAVGVGSALASVACTRAYAPYVIGTFVTEISTTCAESGSEPTFPAATIDAPFQVAVPSILKFGQPTYADFKATDRFGREATTRAAIVINACVNDTECVAAVPFCRCPNSDPSCATTYKRCVACEADIDCSGSTPRCELTTQLCVWCLVDGDCPFGSRCSGNACVAGCSATSCGGQKCLDGGVCVDCLSDVDCGADGGGGIICETGSCRSGCRSDTECPVEIGCPQTCNLQTYTCGGECTGDSCCALEQRCVGGACAIGCYDDTRCAPGRHCTGSPGVCAGCASSSDCATGYYCASNVCVLGCDSDGRCAVPTPRCDTGQKVCVECLSSSDCGSGKVCTSQHVCATGCFTDGDCASQAGKPFCVGAAPPTTPGLCVECSGGLGCDAGLCVSNVCSVGCSGDVDCPPNANGNRCVDAGCISGCVTTAHCASPKPFCVGSSCQECAAGGDCTVPPEIFCDTLGYFCRGCEPDIDGGNVDCSGGTPHCNDAGVCVVCTTAAHCPSATPLCKSEVCATCASNAECAAAIPTRPFCDAGICTPCTSDANCAAGWKCAAGRCVVQPCESCAMVGSLGGRCAACAGDPECDTGYRCAFALEFDAGYRCMKACGTSDECLLLSNGMSCANRILADGGGSAAVCVPRAWTTCEAFSQARSYASCPASCPMATEQIFDGTLCGIPDAGDGACVLPLLGAFFSSGYCSIKCLNDKDCPSQKCGAAATCTNPQKSKVCVKP